MEPFAEVGDIISVFRSLTVDEATIAAGLLEEASWKLRAKVPNIDALVASSTVKAALAKAAVVNAVKRVLMNPEALRQVSHSTGPYSESKTIDSALSTGALYIDPSDLIGISAKKSAVRSFRVNAGLR